MSFVGFGEIATPIVLAIMGAAIAIWLPETKRARTIWIASFVLVGAVAVFAAIRDREEANEETFGGKHFAAVSVLFDSEMDPKGKFPLVITNLGNKSLYDVTLLIFPATDFPSNGLTITIGTLNPFPNDFMRRLNLDVPLRSYAIQIRTKATPDGFSEHLELTQKNGAIHQSYYVCRPGIGYVCREKDRLMDTH